MSVASIESHSAVKSTLKMIECLSDILKVDVIDQTSIDTLQADNYKKVWAHRELYYTARAPHLLAPNERQLESDLDERGIIFSVSSPKGVLASLRLIKRPFEIENYDHGNIDFSKYDEHWEIGRLVTTPQLDHISLAIVVQFLLCSAGLKLFSSKGCTGLVGICKPENQKFFAKFGMLDLQDIYCAARDLNYKMLAGDMCTILNSTAKIIKFENRIRARLASLVR